MQPIHDLAATLMRRSDELAAHTEEPGKITRRYGTPALAEVMGIVEGWMRDAGMQTRRDAIGNLFGLLAGPSDDCPRLMLGGHLDSVRDAGRYDGVLGVLSAIATVEVLRDREEPLPFAIEVVAFADEEGVRFHSLYLGSWSAIGALPPGLLDATDADGITVRQAIRDWGFDPEGALEGSLAECEYIGFVEAHIEQGPRLEVAGIPVGVVSGIVGTRRAHLDVYGTAGHAGTVPMADRHDALVATSEIILAIDEGGRSHENAVATVGEIAVRPGASNVITGGARISLDLRHPDGAVVDELYDEIRTRSAAIAARWKVDIAWRTGQKVEAMSCDDALSGALAAAVEAAGHEPVRLFSGAGHDAVAMSRVMPTTMLFTRCKGGISHNPAESIASEDAAATIDVLVRFVDAMAAMHGR
ncbi:MAG TPA: M20 family metallo-hydrolase [Thermomicrobiales bacterium]|nr:M20 family metallo-hydrolase [Thermomicrobiales bacterium]